MLVKRTKTVAFIAVIVAMVSVGVFGGISFVVYKQDRELKVRLQDIVNMQVQVRELSTLSRVAEESVAERAILETYILREEGVIDFLALIESVGREQGVELTTRTLEVVNPNQPYEELKIEIDVAGSRDAVLHTVRMFENIPYQSYMSGLSFSQTSNAEVSSAWRASFSLFVTKYAEES